MHASLSIRSRPPRAVQSDRSGASTSVDEAVTCARIALEERYLSLLAVRDAASIDELQRVRVRLHTLAEIAADKSERRESALRDWLRAG